ncbi:hypothetical protein EW146_g6478 [Bondarzewia mesenterica]|uniref:DUF6533 domain-containing protein n=1 Tax=Bondarzewia mesenterica TaxID=1095465 RepID=A0A4S4LNE1_9AGAM|nr:hypothetical protein EW146_g6478 [Bondarzewia mesenterica]
MSSVEGASNSSATLIGLEHLSIETYVNACAITVLVYDYLLTFRYEVKYMWNSKWSIIKALFFMTRYPVFVDTICAIYRETDFSDEYLAILNSSTLLALFQNSTHFVPMSSLGTLSTGKGCLADRANIDVVGTYASFTAFDTIIVCLTVFKALQLRKRKFHPLHSNLILTLYRDGMLFYITLFVVSLISVMVILVVATDLMLLLLGMQRVLYSVLSARILFHIHQAIEPKPFEETELPVQVMIHRTTQHSRASTQNMRSLIRGPRLRPQRAFGRSIQIEPRRCSTGSADDNGNTRRYKKGAALTPAGCNFSFYRTTDTMSSPQDTSAVLRGLSHLNIETYINVCAIAVLLYDYLLTLKHKVKYIWPSKWNLPKVLFFCTRYPVFVDTSLVIYLQFGRNLSASTCTKLYDVIGWLVMFGIAVAEGLVYLRVIHSDFKLALLASGIIVLRTLALWGNKSSIKYGLLITLTLTFIAAAVALGKFETTTHFIPMSSLRPLSTGKGCLVGSATIDVVGTKIKMALSFKSRPNVVLRCLQRVLYAVLSGRILLHIHLAHDRDPIEVKLPHHRAAAGSSTAFRMDSRHREVEMDVLENRQYGY